MRIPPELAAWATGVALPLSRRELFCYDAGPRDAPPLLLVHGLGDEADTWRRVIGPLSQRHRVVAPDLPGFGRSPLPAHRRLAPPYLASILAELITHLGMRQVTLVGSSLGALLSQVVALRERPLVARLVLADGGLLAMSGVSKGLLPMLVPGIGERRYRSLAGNLDAAFATLAPYYARLGDLPRREREFLRERVGERVASTTQMRAYFSSFRGLVTWMLVSGGSAGRRAAALAVPTTYVWGAQDHILPLGAGRAAQARHPGARLAVIPEAGHLPHQETPERFLEVMEAELASANAPAR